MWRLQCAQQVRRITWRGKVRLSDSARPYMKFATPVPTAHPSSHGAVMAVLHAQERRQLANGHGDGIWLPCNHSETTPRSQYAPQDINKLLFKNKYLRYSDGVRQIMRMAPAGACAANDA